MSNIKQKAAEWLQAETKDYNEGLAIVRQISPNRGLINTLSNKESLQNLDKINYLISRYLNVDYNPLTGLAEAGPAKVEATQESGTGADAGNTTVNLDDDEQLKTLPAEIQDIVALKRSAFNQRNLLSQKITDLTDEVKEGDPIPAEVEGLTKEALSIDEQIKAYDSQIAYFFKNGKLPEMGKAAGEIESPETIESLDKKINNKKSQVSKAKKASEMAPDNVDKKEKWARLELELKDLIYQRDCLREKAINENQEKGTCS